MLPRIASRRLRVADQFEYFNHALPHRPALELLADRDGFDVGRVAPVQLADRVPEFRHVVHWQAFASLTRSATDQSRPTTPAAIAGVIRRVACRLTKL